MMVNLISKKLLKQVVIISIFLLFNHGYLHAQGGQKITLLFDDFESYQVNTFPSSGGWILINSGWGVAYQIIDDSTSVSGNKSFKLEGATNWAATVQRNYTFPSSVNTVFYEFDAKVTRLQNPIMWYQDLIVWAGEYGSATGSHWFGYVTIQPLIEDGLEYLTSAFSKGPRVNLGEWYHVKVMLDLENDLESLWLDGSLIFDKVPLGTTPNYHFGPAITIEGGNDCHTRIWIDDIHVYYTLPCNFGPEEQPLLFARSKGEPKVETIEWESCGGPGTLNVLNDRISSCEIYLNGEPILGPDNFNQNVKSLAINVELLEGINTLQVELRGKPGGTISLEFLPEN